MLLIRGILRLVFRFLLYGALLFLPIGTWRWPRALQFLVDQGIYGWIRHPMYLGHLLFLIGLPLWLESYLGVVLVPVVFAPVVGRLLVEERTLMNNLQGYAAYTTRVPHRLLPLVW